VTLVVMPTLVQVPGGLEVRSVQGVPRSLLARDELPLVPGLADSCDMRRQRSVRHDVHVPSSRSTLPSHVPIIVCACVAVQLCLPVESARDGHECCGRRHSRRWCDTLAWRR
jgi:hypothetical protein